MWHSKRIHGFTLVEVIIALFILSIISVAALGSFQQMIRAKEVQKAHEAVLTSLSHAYTTLLNDIFQQIEIDEPLTFHEREMRFKRAWDGTQVGVTTASILYTWEGNTLTREIEMGDEQSSHVLLKKVSGVQWQWIVDDTWFDLSVPVPAGKKVRALKLSFRDTTVGELSWIFIRP